MGLSGIEEFIIFGFMPLMIGIFAGRRRSKTSEQTMTAKIVIPSSDPPPEHAIATVELVELRRGGTVLPPIALETAPWRGGGIQNFTVRVDRSSIDPMAFYGLSAHIVADGTVLFETRHPEPAAPFSGDQLTLMLMPAA